MFNLFRKKPDTPPPARPMGIFSTDFERKYRGSPTLSQILERSKILTPDQLTVVNTDGTATGLDQAIAQDSNIQQVKLLNSTTFGVTVPLAQIDWYASQTFIGFQTMAIIAQQWLVNKALRMPAEDATRNDYELTINDGNKVSPKVLDYIRERDEEMHITQRLVNQLYKGRLFGVCIAMYKVESSDLLYYEKPFNLDGVRPGTYKGIVQIDPYWIMPVLDQISAIDPSSPNFYEPTWWIINGKRVHRSHLCVMRNAGEVPDILKPTYYYGGISVTQMICERIYAAERTANEAPMLSLSKRMTVYKADLTEAAGNIDKLKEKVHAWTELMNNFGVKVIGGDEEVNQFDLSLSDLDAVIMTQYQLVSACAGTPATELLGTSPKGFSATGEFEAKSYTKFLKTLQKHYLTPLLRGHYVRLSKSELIPKFGVDTKFTVKWNPTDSPTAKEIAEINYIKAQTDNQLAQTGAIDSFDIRQRLIADPDSGYNGIEDIVDGGPGDRDAQMNSEDPLESPVNAKGTVRQSTGDSDISETGKG